MSPRTRNHDAVALAGQRSSRQGSLLLEVVVGAALLATLLVIINQVVVRLHAQTALIDQQSIAQQTLENLLEEFCSQPWGELESAAIDDLKIPARASSKLPHATVAGEVVDASDPVAAKRITLRIGWQDAAGSEPQGLAATSRADTSQAAGLQTPTPLAPTPLAPTPLAPSPLTPSPLTSTPPESPQPAMTTRTLTTWVYPSVEGDQ